MDEETFNKIVTEVSTFYRTITTPFLNRMSDNDRENAVLWSQKVMSLKNYDSMTKYLTYLAFMIISGRLVTPFDTDPHTSPIPPLPVHVGETKMLDFIEKVVAQCQAVQDNETSSSTAKTGEISAAISSDELAFISTQPAPGVGIRMYLATSAQPFAMWSKANGAPQAVKYNVPAREVIDRGLAVAKEKFYSYLDEIERLNKQNGTGGPATKCTKCQKPAPAGNVSTCNQDTSKSTFDGTISDISYDFGSSNDTSNRSAPVDGAARVPRQAQQEASRDPKDPPCTLRNLPRVVQDAVAGTSGLNTSTSTLPPRVEKHNSSFRTRPPEPLSDDDKRREAQLDEKYERWFGEPQYTRYKEEIRGFMRGGMRIDAIRRAVHTHMRQQRTPGQDLPLYVYDSEDESVPYEIRITHLRERYADVLQNEYGIVDEAELYYLLGLTGLSKKNMEKARELIKYAEEGLIDDDFRKKFHSVQGRTCGRLLPIIEELLQSARQSANSSANTSRSSVAPSSSTIQSTSSNQNRTNGRLNAASGSNHRMKSMPPTSVLDTHSDDTTDTSTTQSNQSNIENEPEPEFFQNIEEVDQSTNSEQPNSTSNSTKNGPNQSESENEPDDSVYPYCPKENCD